MCLISRYNRERSGRRKTGKILTVGFKLSIKRWKVNMNQPKMKNIKHAINISWAS